MGRSSGRAYHTPLDAYPAEGGFLFIVMYGAAKTDWVQNVLAAGTAHLKIRGDEWDLAAPRLVTLEEAARLVSADTNLAPGRVSGIEYLFMEIAA